jgi:hypothetical protein
MFDPSLRCHIEALQPFTLVKFTPSNVKGYFYVHRQGSEHYSIVTAG